VSRGDPTDGVARTLVSEQDISGYWYAHNYNGNQYPFETAWAIIMLTRTVVVIPPVAVATANPNPAVAGQTVQLDGSASYHPDSTKLIDSWQWDLNNDGTYDVSGPFPTVSFPAVGNYPIKLRVTDDGTPELSATTVLTIVVSTPPLAPTANAAGPYNLCPAAKPWFLDGLGSTNPDEGASEPGQPADTIVSFEWDLDGDGQFDDATGVHPDVTAFFTGKGPGSYLIQLKVTDRTATSFPSSSFGDLSDTDSTIVVVRAGTDAQCICVNNLAARAKPGKIQLTWTHTGPHHYNVYRGTIAGGPYLKIASTTSTYSTYLDLNVVNGTQYYYVVREANFLDEESCQSNESSATPRAR
jgi:PKD repeat protein